MKYAAATQKLTAFRQQIADIRQQMRKVQAEVEPQQVANYEFRVPDGIVTLTELFGDHEDLMVVHNMGVSCPGCTLWADGYNGIHQHVTSRAAFVVSSPDAPEVQQKFAASRGWVFPMVSHMGNSFAEDMGYRTANRLLPATTSAQSGTCSTCCRKDRPGGCPNCGIPPTRGRWRAPRQALRRPLSSRKASPRDPAQKNVTDKRSVTDVSPMHWNRCLVGVRRHLGGGWCHRLGPETS
jgi:peroxiredoxin